MSVFGCATPTPAPTAPVTPAPAAKVAPPVAPPAPQAAVVSPVVMPPAPVVSPVTSAAPAVGTEARVPHIALLLPLKSASFGKAADAVQQGFLAAAGKEAKGLPVRVYPCNDESTEIVALYHQAIQAGAVAVAGPLTRNGVAALAANPDLPTPTLALNLLDSPRTDHLFFFGLPLEAEARQSADRATDAGLLRASIVSTNTLLSRRLAQAFKDSWLRAGGILDAEITYNGDPAPLRALQPEPGSAVFLAAEADKARLLRPYIDSALPVYATSQIFSGNGNALINYDLADIRFVDMPWMLQPDHPAVMIYPRPATPLSPEMERLYALGIDAYRLVRIILEHDEARALPLDGVTGRITLSGHNTFQREAIPAIIRQGQGVPVENKLRP